MEIDMSQMGMPGAPPENTIKLACLDLASKACPDDSDVVLETAKKFYEWVSEKR